MKYKVSTYGCDGKKWESCGDNLSDVITKLIYITAKVTERYASDIVIDINAMQERIKENKSFDWLLMFYDSGVHRRAIEDNQIEWEPFNGMCIQYWRLTYDNENVVLTRANIRRADGRW